MQTKFDFASDVLSIKQKLAQTDGLSPIQKVDIENGDMGTASFMNNWFEYEGFPRITEWYKTKIKGQPLLGNDISHLETCFCRKRHFKKRKKLKAIKPSCSGVLWDDKALMLSRKFYHNFDLLDRDVERIFNDETIFEVSNKKTMTIAAISTKPLRLELRIEEAPMESFLGLAVDTDKIRLGSFTLFYERSLARSTLCNVFNDNSCHLLKTETISYNVAPHRDLLYNEVNQFINNCFTTPRYSTDVEKCVAENQIRKNEQKFTLDYKANPSSLRTRVNVAESKQNEKRADKSDLELNDNGNKLYAPKLSYKKTAVPKDTTNIAKASVDQKNKSEAKASYEKAKEISNSVKNQSSTHQAHGADSRPFKPQSVLYNKVNSSFRKAMPAMLLNTPHAKPKSSTFNIRTIDNKKMTIFSQFFKTPLSISKIKKPSLAQNRPTSLLKGFILSKTFSEEFISQLPAEDSLIIDLQETMHYADIIINKNKCYKLVKISEDNVDPAKIASVMYIKQFFSEITVLFLCEGNSSFNKLNESLVLLHCQNLYFGLAGTLRYEFFCKKADMLVYINEEIAANDDSLLDNGFLLFLKENMNELANMVQIACNCDRKMNLVHVLDFIRYNKEATKLDFLKTVFDQ